MSNFWSVDLQCFYTKVVRYTVTPTPLYFRSKSAPVLTFN